MLKDTVLYVDDDADDRQVFAEVMKEVHPNTVCQTVGDAVGALGVLKSKKEQLLCIFLDVNMPVTNGFQLLENIRVNKQYDQIPIFILSTSRTQQGESRARELGAKDYLLKPNSYHELVVLMDSCFKAHLRQRS
jgi:CheY-like chemotaxis protein